ncbi:MAG: hypothetical protein HY329_00375 [Chloroflexi bacterium]|nr:hypothetical protein [Chloroflexota bacterium]
MDGPVVKTALAALDAENVDLILPYVWKPGEDEVTEAFEKTVSARNCGPEAKEVADRYFLETVVRVHRAGEGAPYTGLKPAGLDHGPVLPVAEQAIETASPDELLDLLADTVRAETRERFDELMRLRSRTNGNIDESRKYVDAMLGLEIYAHKLYQCAKMGLHESHTQPHAD